MTLSVVIITFNEEANIGRTLESVKDLVRALDGEIIVVDSGSTDKTREIAASFGAKVFVEEWKGFAAQKNSAIEKASGDWVLSLDADEEVSPELAREIPDLFPKPEDYPTEEQQHAHFEKMQYRFDAETKRQMEELRKESERTGVGMVAGMSGYRIPRKNFFLGRWIRHGGFYPDTKLRLFSRKSARFDEHRLVHEDASTDAITGRLRGALIHHAYPTLDVYLEHMRRYADLGAEMIRHKPRSLLLLNRWFNPPLTFLYNYVFRLGFLDGREGFLLHWNHSRYVSWKYAKALELSRKT